MVKYAPLKLLAAGEVPTSRDDRVFRPRRIDSFLALGLFSVLSTGALGWPWLAPTLDFDQEVPGWISTIVGLVLLIFVWIAWRSLKASLRREAWLLRAAHNGLYLRFRSHLNYQLLADDPAVVFIPKAEIASLRAHLVKAKRTAEVEDETAPLGGEKYLEIHLHDDDQAALAEALIRERQLRGDGKGGGGTIALHYPVRVLEGGIIEVNWAGISPGLARAVASLGRLYQLKDEVVSQAPMLEDLPPEEREDALRKLMQGGERILAIKLARKFYGYDITEAKTFLEGLDR